MISRRALAYAAAAAAMACGGSVEARAQTEIQWWHAMGGQLGETLNALADGFNKSQKDYKVVSVYKGTYT
jgi:sn-glycerol 3-phosphate transport system substrate-binding protein